MGMDTTIATPIDANEISICASVLSPNRLRLLKKKLNASTKTCISSSPQTSSAPWSDRPLDEDQRDVDDDREQDREHPGADELGLEAGLDRVEDRLPQPACADASGHRREADGGDGGD